MAGCMEGIHRALVLGLVLISGTAIEQALSVGPQVYRCLKLHHIYTSILLLFIVLMYTHNLFINRSSHHASSLVPIISIVYCIL